MQHLARRAAALALIALFALGGATASADTIRVQSTTDTVDAGLVDGLLKPAYQAAQPGDTLQYTAVGTGKALDNARLGLADVVITHAPTLEAQFVADGFSYEPSGRAIFYSDYVIIGPLSDPAGVFGDARHDAITALEKIAAAGEAGTATFVSRGDNSGTNVQEQLMWGMTGASVQKQAAQNGGGAAGRSEPWTGNATDYPDWYEKSGKGQAANVLQTDVCATTPANPNGGCYTMVDRGTFNKLLNASTITQLKIVSDKNTAGVRGGENLLINPFSVYIVNPDKIATVPGPPPVPNVAAAQRFVDFLTSASFQASVDVWPSASDPAFRADAFAKVDVDTALPPSVASGASVPLTVTLSDRLPGGGVIDGLPVQLQASTDGGTTFSDVGAPVATDAAGKASFSPAPTATTTYRVSLPRYRKFSPSSSTLGVVAVVAPTPDPGTSSGGGSPSAAKDVLAPTVTKATLSARRFSIVVSEAGTVKVSIRRRTTRTVKRNGRTRRITTVKRVKSLTLVAGGAGRVSRSFAALAPGSYELVVQVRDQAGNTRTRTIRLAIRGAKTARAIR